MMTDQIVQQPAHKNGTSSDSAPPPAASKGAPSRSVRPRVMIAGGLLVAGLAALGVWHFFLAGPSGQPGVIAVSGRIEGDDSAVAAKTSGRIREITVRE